MQHPEIFKLHAEFCKAIANEKRLMIIALLAEGEQSVGELAAAIDVPIANISQHLNLLRSKNIVHGRKDGQTVFYSLVQPKLYDACLEIRKVLLEDLRDRGIAAGEIADDEIV